MRTLEEAEAWARKFSAVLKVNFVEGVASLQVGGFITYAKGDLSIAKSLPELVADLAQQVREKHGDEHPSRPG